MDYQPTPIDTSAAILPQQLLDRIEILAKNAHDTWAVQRFAEGWRYGPRRDDLRKEHPWLVPYEDLPESARQYDRNLAVETLKAAVVLGYRIVGP